jgi:hypothetical protein
LGLNFERLLGDIIESINDCDDGAQEVEKCERGITECRYTEGG